MGEQHLQFRIGSQAFFKDYPDFHPSDVDNLEFDESPKLYKNVMQLRATDKTECHFWWRKMTPDEYVEYALNSKVPMEIGKFLVPEVANYLGFTLDHLKQLTPVVDKLDDKHTYEKIIFDSYIENGDFYLTDEQRLKAYEEYKAKRK